jgi:hypothetical protein
MIDLGQILNGEIMKVDKWIKQAAIERDESATSTESAHDQTRQIANQLFNSLLEEKAKLQKLENVVKKYQNVLEIKKQNGEVFKAMVVPDGLGGKNIDGTLLVGEGSPLGQKLRDLKTYDVYEMNGVSYQVTDIILDSGSPIDRGQASRNDIWYL